MEIEWNWKRDRIVSHLCLLRACFCASRLVAHTSALFSTVGRCVEINRLTFKQTRTSRTPIKVTEATSSRRSMPFILCVCDRKTAVEIDGWQSIWHGVSVFPVSPRPIDKFVCATGFQFSGKQNIFGLSSKIGELKCMFTIPKQPVARVVLNTHIWNSLIIIKKKCGGRMNEKRYGNYDDECSPALARGRPHEHVLSCVCALCWRKTRLRGMPREAQAKYFMNF